MVTLQNVQGHTGLTHPYQFCDIWALWHSGLWETHFCDNQKKWGTERVKPIYVADNYADANVHLDLITSASFHMQYAQL